MMPRILTCAIESHCRPPQYFRRIKAYNAMEHLKQGHTKYGLVTDEFPEVSKVLLPYKIF